MHITVDEKKELRVLQEEFSGLFPYLKIQVLKPANGVPASPLQPNGKTIGDVKLKANGDLSITPDMTTSALKQSFMHNYGLLVQVLRRFGNTWIETTVTDAWTLAEQNKHGERLSIR